MNLIGLADCNNFYCSCERVFRPELNGRPVVVLSNNDGCIIARSEEAKQLGLKMGTPFFQVRKMLEEQQVAVFSSNYTLYGSLSNRVMSLLSHYLPGIEPYSIDECFLDVSGLGDSAATQRYGQMVSAAVRKGVGIPISIGCAPTKTLAKMGSKFAKKYKGYDGCCMIDTDERREKALELFPVSDVWGIGRQTARKLDYWGVRTAADFAHKRESWVRGRFPVTVVRTWNELNGQPCISTDELPQKQSICTSRSFSGQGIADYRVLEEAVAHFGARCADKLRRQKSMCRGVSVFAWTSPFCNTEPACTIQASVLLPVPTQAQSEIVGMALSLLRTRYPQPPAGSRPDRHDGEFFFKKAGVVLYEITPERPVQLDLFDSVDRKRQQALTRAIDEINRKNGFGTVRQAVQGTDCRFDLAHAYLSHRYTTDIDDLLVVKLR